MIREDFIEVVKNTGMATLKELRQLTLNRDPNDVTEFQLLELPHFNENKFAEVIASRFKLTYIDLTNAKVSSETVSMLRRSLILKYRTIPIQSTANKITLATFDPSVIEKNTEVVQELKKPVEYILTNLSSWKKLFEHVQESVDDLVKTVVEVKGGGEKVEKEVTAEDISDDVITYVNRILADAFIKKASDIHVEPYEKVFRIRFRIDGTLIKVASPPRVMMLPIISRLKIMAQLDISEKRKPQDGRIKLMIGGKPIDFRVSSLPTLFGEKVVLRLLDSTNLKLDMTKLGFSRDQLDVFNKGIKKPYGICLVTGPTGSGKTTTLYSALQELNVIGRNISTAEDPVEFNLEGINQVNVRKDIGLTFASSLKAFLRQDPDVIMVGEIRDLEVGEMAIEAALTGHLVLSTLHTNDAPSTVTRLLNMGIEPFLVVAALNVVVAQRLCRRICLNCRVKDESVTVKDLVSIGIASSSAQKMSVYKGQGCEVCNNTGYKGRVAIHEVMEITLKLRELILSHASSDELKKQAMRDGMKTLRMTALTKVAQGLTTIEEAISNSASDKD